MKILIDGDACNKIDKIERIAKEYNNIECHIYCDTTRLLTSNYSEVHIIDKGRDNVDFAIVNNCIKNDLVITNDVGLASLVLSKEARVINKYGFEITKHNVSLLLNSRYIKSRERRYRKQVKGGLVNEIYDKSKYCFGRTLVRIINETIRSEN